MQVHKILAVGLLTTLVTSNIDTVSARTRTKTAVGQCWFQVPNGQVSRTARRHHSSLVRVTCDPGFHTRKGASSVLVKCSRSYRSRQVHLCLRKASTLSDTLVSHPQSLLFQVQGDDPTANEGGKNEIILLDDKEDVSETGVYETANPGDYDYAQYDYDGDYDYEDEEGDVNGEGEEYGSYYDYDYEKSGQDYEDDPEPTNASPKPEVIPPEVSSPSSSVEPESTEYEDETIQEIEEEPETVEVLEEKGEEEAEVEVENVGNVPENHPEPGGDNNELNHGEEPEIVEDTEEENTDDPDDYEEYDEDYTDEYEEEPEEEEEDQNTGSTEDETELLYRNYEILSDFYKKHFVDLRVLDTTCDPERIVPPKIDHGFVKEYLTTENVLMPGDHYHEIIYDCDPGYKMSDTSQGHMFCQQEGWMGVEPYCELDPDHDYDMVTDDKSDNYNTEDPYEECLTDHGCEHTCRIIQDEPTCTCYEGTYSELLLFMRFHKKSIMMLFQDTSWKM